MAEQAPHVSAWLYAVAKAFPKRIGKYPKCTCNDVYATLSSLLYISILYWLICQSIHTTLLNSSGLLGKTILPC
jgi:hypothetical protein